MIIKKQEIRKLYGSILKNLMYGNRVLIIVKVIYDSVKGILNSLQLEESFGEYG